MLVEVTVMCWLSGNSNSKDVGGEVGKGKSCGDSGGNDNDNNGDGKRNMGGGVMSIDQSINFYLR